jgi:hypothetical protein
MSYAVGVDVPVSQMPAGMAFDGGGGNNILGTIGSGFLKGLTGGLGDIFGGSSEQGSSGYGAPRTTYADDTKRLMQAMLLQSMQSFDPSRIKSTIGTI